MEFKLTEDTLQRLEQKEEITVRDIMGFVVTDICWDLQNGCGELTRLKLGNDEQEEEDAILFICNLARKLAKIQSRNQEKFNSPDHRPVWDGANKKLQEAMTQLTSIEEEINKKQQIVAELEETLQKFGDNQAKIAEYERLTEEKENALRLVQSIEEKCQELQEETARIKEIKIPAVRQQQEAQEAEFQAAEQELEDEKQKQQMHIMELKRKLENKKQEMQPYIAELKQKKQELQGLEDQASDLCKKKQDLAETTESVQRQKEETERQIQQAEAEIEAIRQKISADKQRLTDKKEDYSWQCEEQKHVDKEMEKLEDSFGASLLAVRSSQKELREIYELFTRDQILESEWFFDQNKVKELQRYFLDSLTQTEENIEQSRAIYNKLLKYLENGGN